MSDKGVNNEIKINGNILSQDTLETNNNKKNKDSIKYLPVIYHEPQYELPIPLNSRYKHLSNDEKTQILINYFDEIKKQRHLLAKQSLFFPSKTDSLTGSSKNKKSNDTKISSKNSTSTSNDPVYITRSGRIMKRHCYTENLLDNNSSGSSSVNSKNKTSLSSSITTTTTTTTITKKRKISQVYDENGKEQNKMVDCPICKQRFSSYEIEEHASNCGDLQNLSDFSHKKVICSWCNNVINENNFEEHTKQCNIDKSGDS